MDLIEVSAVPVSEFEKTTKAVKVNSKAEMIAPIGWACFEILIFSLHRFLCWDETTIFTRFHQFSLGYYVYLRFHLIDL